MAPYIEEEEEGDGLSLPAGVPATAELAPLRGAITPVGLILPADMTFEEWAAQLQVVWFLYEWSPWALADMLEFGAEHFSEGDKYLQAVKITGKARQTLYNKTLLARQFPNRDGLRSEKLSPGHHSVLLGMPEEDKRHYLKEGEKKYEESNGHFGWRDFKAYVEQEERERSGARVEKVKPPPKCGECFGSGQCARCHGSGEEHSA